MNQQYRVNDDGSVTDFVEGQTLYRCECDNTHQQNDTVCRWCWAHGRRHWHDPDVAIKPWIRMSPQDDGTAIYLYCEEDTDKEIPATEAFDRLREGAWLEIALNDPTDDYSHYEATPTNFHKV